MDSKNIKLRTDISKKLIEINSKIYDIIGHHANLGLTIFEALLAMLPNKQIWKAPRLLDIGGGNGEFIRLFLKKYPKSKAVYIDAMPDILQSASRRLSRFKKRTKFVEQSLEYLSSTKGLGKFDVITANNVFHFVEAEDLPQLVKACYQLLKPKGFFFSTYCADFPEDLKSLYNSGRSYFQSKDKLSKNEQQKLDKLLKKRDTLIETAGKHIPSHKMKNVFHNLEDVLGLMHSAGFTSVDCCWKLYQFAMCVGQKVKS